MQPKRLPAFLLLIVWAVTAHGQQALHPDNFLGYKAGERFTPHHRVVSYFEHVAESLPTVELEYYGTTNEHRPLLIAYVSSRENLARLEEIRLNNLRMAGTIPGPPEDSDISIVWLSFNIHGNESVSMEAAIYALHELTDPSNTAAAEWLKHTVVIIDPTVNPDGRDRYATWYHQMVGASFNPNPWDREHAEPWPGGRANHYLFDLNRDWAWQTQKESRHRGVIYQKWLPHVHADFHEMGVESPYYFAPAAEPLHEVITPWQREMQTLIGKNHAKYFDQNFWLYYTKENFDLFYPSYGDTWPTYQGAIGMTYEQGGSGRAGLGIITQSGDTLTLKDRIAHQYKVAISTVEAVANNHQRVVTEFRNYYNTSRNNPAFKYKTYVIRDNGNPDNLRAFLELMDLQGILYGVAPAARNNRGFNYTTGRDESFRMESGDVLISMYQPKSVLANVLLEPRTTIIDSLTYDITAWSLPYAYGLQAWALTDRVNPRMDDVKARFQFEQTPVEFQNRVYAYLSEWKSLDDARFLSALMQRGVNVSTAHKEFKSGDKEFARGALVITRTLNENMGADFDRIVLEEAKRHNRKLYPTYTGFMNSGVDLGSDYIRQIKPAKVAVLAGSGVSSLAFGEVWHFFDQQIGFQVTNIDLSYFNRVPLDSFNVLVMPSGFYGDLLSGDSWTKIREWISEGGTLIALESTVNQLAGKPGLEDLKRKEAENDDENRNDRLRVYGEEERRRMTESLAGGIFRVNIDHSHPLGFGYNRPYYTLKRSTAAYDYLKNGWNVGVTPPDAHVSGFVGYKLKPRLSEVLNFGEIPLGSGNVVVMVDNPLFRAFWHDGKLLFANAVFHVGN